MTLTAQLNTWSLEWVWIRYRCFFRWYISVTVMMSSDAILIMHSLHITKWDKTFHCHIEITFYQKAIIKSIVLFEENRPYLIRLMNRSHIKDFACGFSWNYFASVHWHFIIDSNQGGTQLIHRNLTILSLVLSIIIIIVVGRLRAHVRNEDQENIKRPPDLVSMVLNMSSFLT